MNIPVKINPDNIRESVIEIRYIANVPAEVLIGLLYKVFEGHYTYTRRPLKTSPAPHDQATNVHQHLSIQIGSQTLFYNEKISILLSQNSLVINCLNGYIGWDSYRKEIKKALEIIWSTGYFMQWSRVGLRYISEYPKKDLKECIKFSFTFGLPEVQSLTTAFHSEFIYSDARVILNLNNKVPVIRQDSTDIPPETVPTSIIDIDVISENPEVQTLEELLKVIETNHLIEKKIYFGMLNEEYLKTVNPQY